MTLTSPVRSFSFLSLQDRFNPFISEEDSVRARLFVTLMNSFDRPLLTKLKKESMAAADKSVFFSGPGQ